MIREELEAICAAKYERLIRCFKFSESPTILQRQLDQGHAWLTRGWVNSGQVKPPLQLEPPAIANAARELFVAAMTLRVFELEGPHAAMLWKLANS